MPHLFRSSLLIALLGAGCAAEPSQPEPTDRESTKLSVSAPIELDATRVDGSDPDSSSIASAGGDGTYALSWCAKGQRVIARYDASGVQLDAPPRVLFESCGNAALVRSDAGYVGVYNGTAQGLMTNILRDDGTVGNPQVVSGAVNWTSVPQLVSVGHELLLASGGWLRRLSSDGTPVGEGRIYSAAYLSVASDGEEYLVVSGTTAEKFPAGIDPVPTKPVTISPDPYDLPTPGQLTWVGEHWVLGSTSGIKFFDRALVQTGALDIPHTADPLPTANWEPLGASAAVSGYALLLWTEADFEEDNQEAINQRTNAVMVDPATGAVVVPHLGGGLQIPLTLTAASIGETAVVAWDERGAGTFQFSIDATGQATSTTPVATRVNTQSPHGLYFDSSEHRAFWLDSGGPGLHSARLSEDGTQLLSTEALDIQSVPLAINARGDYLIAQPPDDASSPSQVLSVRVGQLGNPGPWGSLPFLDVAGVASDGSGFLAAGFDEWTGETVYAIVPADGEPSAPIPLGKQALDVRVSWGGYCYLTSWQDGGALKVRRIAQDGTPLDSDAVSVAGAGDLLYLERSLYGGGVFLLVFHTSQGTFGLRMDPQGNALDSEPFALPFGEPLGFDGQAFVLTKVTSEGVDLVRLGPDGNVLEQSPLALPGMYRIHSFSTACDGSSVLLFSTNEDGASRLYTAAIAAEVAGAAYGCDPGAPPPTPGSNGTGGNGTGGNGTGGNGTGGNGTGGNGTGGRVDAPADSSCTFSPLGSGSKSGLLLYGFCALCLLRRSRRGRMLSTR
ncbi:MAG: hypothetical protein R3B07_06145 [Polyangiaceae bacterium]